MIQPILAVPEHQERKAHLLREYCYQLDQTEVQLIVMSREEQAAFQAQYPNNRFHSLQAQGIHRAARELNSPFIWLEVDAIPLKAGWAAALSAEYETCGKKFLISSDSHPPHDLVGGIGCYPQETDWLLPQHFPRSSWDMWLIEAVPHLVARTAAIQHSYGWYNSRGFIDKIHEFPRDRAILRPGALLFHRDPTQSLII